MSKAIAFFFILIVFLTTRQVPLSFLAPLMNVGVLAILVLSLVRRRYCEESSLTTLMFLFFPLCISLVYSILLTDNSLIQIFRFYTILLTVGLAYHVTVNSTAVRWFVWINVLQSVVLICIYIFLLLFTDSNSYLPIRHFFLSKGWGDIYTYNGIFYRIQIQGSALLLVSFLVSLESRIIQKRSLVLAILCIGIVLAGNFAFLIAGAFYFIVKFSRVGASRNASQYLRKLLGFLVLVFLLSPLWVPYVINTIGMKQEMSLGTRWDQFDLLMRDLFENPFSGFLGRGLGNTINVVSSFRDYTDDVYFELQSVYILNQLGILLFLLYIVYHVLMVIRRWWSATLPVILIYVTYITYAVTNPYIFDTTHFIVIIVLNSCLLYEANRKNTSIGNSRPV